jgi:hypothetical protein
LPKHGNTLDELEDALAWNEQRNRFAIADGASESICAGEWAKLLCKEFVADESKPAELGTWIKKAQRRWREQVVDQPSHWHVQEKLRDGAFSTFLGVQIEDSGEIVRWRAVAVGDSCLFLIRGNRLQESFPVASADAFGNRPILIGSQQRDRLRASTATSTMASDDLILLMTDALAEWFLAQHHAGLAPWLELQSLSNDSFPNWVNLRRRDLSLKNDDVTLVMIETKMPNASHPE